MSSRAVAALLFLAAGCVPVVTPDDTTPGPLRAQVASRLLDAPVGTAMGGYLRSRPRTEPGSPWAQQLPSSRGVHTEPTVRVVALTNGPSRVALVRLDTVITSPTLRARIIAGLAALGERAEVLVFATHTHAGPARFLTPARLGSSTGTDFVSLVMDSYDAEVEARLANAAVAAVREAFADLRPVRLGVATADGAAFNNDRRCENDPVYGHDFRDTTMTVLRLDEVTEQGPRPLTALVHYAAHGTALGSDNTLFSTEVSGALELYAGDALGVPVVYVQGAAGDVSPKGSPFGHDGLQRLERQGRAQAALVVDAWQRATPRQASAAARLDFKSRGVMLTRDAMGYPDGEFVDAPAIQCAAGGPGPCGAVKSTPGDVLCLPLERRRPFRTAVSLLWLEDLLFVTLPGEPGTGLSRKVTAALAPLAEGPVLPVGYAQDHYGYLLEEDDWLRGGYEPTVSPWGWRFGGYLLSEVETFAATVNEEQPAPDVPAAPEPTTRPVTDSARAPVIAVSPVDAERLDTALLQFEGGDPALGLPRVAVERQEAGAFVPLRASPTRVVVNGPEVLLRYEATPSFSLEPGATTRRHVWTAQFETVPSTPLGAYRFVVTGRAKVAGQVRDYTLSSSPFEVRASAAVTATARLSAGRLLVEARFPPNPTVYAQGREDVEGNFRVRDQDSSPAEGAKLRGGSVKGSLTPPGGAASEVTLAWSDAEGGWVGPPLAQAGTWALAVPTGQLVDAHGNATARATSLTVQVP